VGALSRVALGTALAAAAAVGIVVLVAGRSPVQGVAPTAPLTVQASFDRTLVGFGDRLDTRVVVLFDRRTVDAFRVRVAEDLAPLQPLTPAHVTRTTRGQLVTLTYDVPAACLDEACLAPHGQRRLRLAPVRVDAGAVSREATWPALSVRGRVSAADLIPNNPPLRADVAPPPVRYRIAPRTLANLLELAAVVLAAAGVALAGRQLWALQRARQGREPRLSDIERALALARDAETRPPADRRRALGLLARLLARRDDRLAGAARDLAWSEPAPTTDKLSELVAQVEREVNGR
jgi:hypothetical protein